MFKIIIFQITVDHVIMAVGAKPNTELAIDAGLEIDPNLGGFLVNSELQARTDLYIVSFYAVLIRYFCNFCKSIFFLGW